MDGVRCEHALRKNESLKTMFTVATATENRYHVEFPALLSNEQLKRPPSFNHRRIQ